MVLRDMDEVMMIESLAPCIPGVPFLFYPKHSQHGRLQVGSGAQETNGMHVVSNGMHIWK